MPFALLSTAIALLSLGLMAWVRLERAKATRAPQPPVPTRCCQYPRCEFRFQELTASIPALVWFSDETGATTYMGRRSQQFVGPVAAGADGWMAAVEPADLELVRKARAGRQPFRLEYRMRRADGKVRWISDQAAPRSTGSEFGGWIGCAQDITDRKLAEGAVRASEERVRMLMEGIRDYAIFLLDVDGRIASWNGGATQMLHYTTEEIVGRSFSIFYPLEEVEAGQVTRTLGEAASNSGKEEEGWRLRRGGDRFWGTIRLGPIRNECGDLMGFTCVVRDITEAHQRAEQLRLLDSATAHAHDAIAILDATQPGFPLRYTNAAFNRLTDIQAKLFEFGGAAARRALETALRTHRPAFASFEHYTPDGGVLCLEMSAVPGLGANGLVEYLTAVLHDVTGRRAAEQQIRSYAAELEEKNRELEAALAASREATELKSRFLANMSHEIRTPMNGVVGMLELLSASELTQEQKECVETVRESSRALLRLINDILDLARIESGRLELEVAPFSPAEVARKECSMAALNARNKGLELKLAVDEKVPQQVSGDALRFRQVLTNLLNNAIKFTEKGGVSVALSAGRPEPGETVLRCDIHDTGVGIRHEDQIHLFERFRQGDNSTTRRFGGSGLGLAIAQQLTQLMGGVIGAESEPGRGSHFWFTVRVGPVAAEAVAEPVAMPPTPVPEGSGQPRRVLLVEDNPVNQLVAHKMLEKSGYRAEVVANGVQAVEAVEQGRFDLILMDVQMPEMDGLEATRRIRRFENGDLHTPIVAMTANAMTGDRERCLQAGMDDYLSKPLSLKALSDALNRWTREP